jgi:RimJ/RimL family protein N-acetyltransferase
MALDPVTLTGERLRLEPLDASHIPDLTLAGEDRTIWQYFNMPLGWTPTLENMTSFVRELLHRQVRGVELPFAMVHGETGRAIGMSRYVDIVPHHRRLEINGTWLGKAYQRTGLHAESKYLLLRHAFEALDCGRVQIKADRRNQSSLKALERMGAVCEGVLRRHMIMPDGHYRDSVIWSIIEPEWPAVKAHLEDLMTRKAACLPLNQV